VSGERIYRAPGEMPPKPVPGGASVGFLDGFEDEPDPYRGPAELPPRMNAYGGLGNLYVSAPRVHGGGAPLTHSTPPAKKPVITTGTTPPIHKTTAPKHTSPGIPTKKPNTVAQPPAPAKPKPAPTTPGPSTSKPPAYSAQNCPTGPGSNYYVDAAGNCTNDWGNPYSLYLPTSASPAPSPTVSTNGCPTGQQPDAYGNCVTSSQDCPSGLYPDDNGNCIAYQGSAGSTLSTWMTDLENWLGESTIVSGVPNYWFAGGGSLVLLYLFFGKKRR
jgi:hypothetical protein